MTIPTVCFHPVHSTLCKYAVLYVLIILVYIIITDEIKVSIT